MQRGSVEAGALVGQDRGRTDGALHDIHHLLADSATVATVASLRPRTGHQTGTLPRPCVLAATAGDIEPIATGYCPGRFSAGSGILRAAHSTSCSTDDRAEQPGPPCHPYSSHSHQPQRSLQLYLTQPVPSDALQCSYSCESILLNRDEPDPSAAPHYTAHPKTATASCLIPSAPYSSISKPLQFILRGHKREPSGRNT